mgnify:CR=1 FL=1
MQPHTQRGSDEPAGFGHGKGRVALEIGGVVAALALAIWGAFALASWGAGTLVALVPAEAEEKLGEYTWEQVAPASGRCTDPGPMNYVMAVSAPLLAAIDSPYTFRFAVVDDPSINAFALPGGFVTVHMGLLEAAESGDEVAAVLAHEMQHVLLRHGVVRILRQVGGWVLVGTVLGFVDLGSLVGAAVTVVGTGYDRDQEREADEHGRALLRRARIDPRGMAIFFDRLAKETAGMTPPEILSTHPGSAERAEAARAGEGLDGGALTLPSPKGLRCR